MNELNTHKRIFNCRICGFRMSSPPWGEDGQSPNYEICSCCGVEFGNEDYTLEAAKEYRDSWIKQGAKWFESNEKLDNWNLEIQMQDIPKEFKER